MTLFTETLSTYMLSF